MTSATNVDRWLYDNSPYMNFFTLTVRNYTFFLYIYISYVTKNKLISISNNAIDKYT